jgi:hypothetical protein
MEVTKRPVDATDPLLSEKSPTTQWMVGCIGYTFGLDEVEKRKISFFCRKWNKLKSYLDYYNLGFTYVILFLS